MAELVHYLVSRKNRHHGEAIAEGFGARCVPAESGERVPGAVHIVGGLQHGSDRIMREVLGSGEQYLFVDRAYFGGGPGTDRLRITWNGYQQSLVCVRPDDRLQALGVELKPWRERGEHILLVPPGDAICELFGLGDWLGITLQRLQKVTQRPVMVSRKGDPRPLAERLTNCHCVVTYTSNVAVDGILAGVPAIVSTRSAAWPVAGSLSQLEQLIEAPPMPSMEFRRQWAASLAYGQFTLDEIRSGYARQVVFRER